MVLYPKLKSIYCNQQSYISSLESYPISIQLQNIKTNTIFLNIITTRGIYTWIFNIEERNFLLWTISFSYNQCFMINNHTSRLLHHIWCQFNYHNTEKINFFSMVIPDGMYTRNLNIEERISLFWKFISR